MYCSALGQSALQWLVSGGQRHGGSAEEHVRVERAVFGGSAQDKLCYGGISTWARQQGVDNEGIPEAMRLCATAVRGTMAGRRAQADDAIDCAEQQEMAEQLRHGGRAKRLTRSGYVTSACVRAQAWVFWAVWVVQLEKAAW
jgi:hypothetical protein